MRVIDTSVAFKWYVNEADSHLALRLLGSDEMFVAPDVIIPEFANAGIRRAELGDISDAALDGMLGDLPEMFLEIFPAALLARDAVRAARELGHSLYDCFFLALAEREGIPLVTADKEFIRSAERAGRAELVVHLADAVRKESE